MEPKPTTETKRPARKRLVIAAAAVIVVAISVFVAVRPGEREPEYQGKKLSEWALVSARAGKAFSEASFGYTYSEVRTNRELQALRAEAGDARNVVVRLGTNSIPWLLKQIVYETPRWRWRVFLRLGQIPGVRGCGPLLRAVLGEDWTPPPGVALGSPAFHQRRNRALLILGIMGPQAQAAVPALQQIVKDPKMSAEAKLCASMCLADVTRNR